MSEVTLTVPAEYVEDFCVALAVEMTEEASILVKERASTKEAREWRRETSVIEARQSDFEGAMGLLAADAAMYLAVSRTPKGEPAQLAMLDNQGSVAFACEQFARKVVGPRLAELLESGPINADALPEIREQIEPDHLGDRDVSRAVCDPVPRREGGGGLMATVTLTCDQAAAVFEELECYLGAHLDSNELTELLEYEARHTAALELARQLHRTPFDSGAITVEISDVSAAMRAVSELLEYADGSAGDALHDIQRGPVCAEDLQSWENGLVTTALERHREALRRKEGLLWLLGALAIQRSREMEFPPYEEVRGSAPGFMLIAKAEFMGSPA